LNKLASRSRNWLASLAAGADRLVHPSVGVELERTRHRRLVLTGLLAPVLTAAALVQALATQIGGVAIVTLTSAVIGLAWLAVTLLAASGKARIAEAALLMLATLSTATLVAAAGPSSPLALMGLMPAAECLWVRRDRTGLIAGLAASVAVCLAQAQISAVLAPSPADGWHWLVPAAYLATIALRAVTFLAERERQAAARRPAGAEDLIEAVVLRLSRAGEVVDASAKAAPLLGLQPALLLGSGLFDRVHVADRVAYLCALSDMREGAAARKLEIRLRAPRASAEESDEKYSDFALELVDTGDPSEPVMAVLRENGEIVALRAQLAAARDGADQVETAKSRFLGVVSHELRTPLNAIIGFSDMLEHEMFGPFADPRQKEYVGLIRESGNHLLAVVTSILDVSKIECGSYPIQPEPFRFRDAVETCRSMMRLQADRKSLTLEADIPPAVGQIVADRRAVQQILINLISNAVKFTPSGGIVSVGANRLGSRVHFWVNDTGIGMSEEDLGRIGQPFTQVRNDYTREYEGAGLGLSLVKGLVALHEGAMMVESAPGEGTMVTISLPAAGPGGRAPSGKADVIQLQNDEGNDGQIKKIA
jgi:cell cycle sensor histidine kinase DivJ